MIDPITPFIPLTLLKTQINHNYNNHKKMKLTKYKQETQVVTTVLVEDLVLEVEIDHTHQKDIDQKAPIIVVSDVEATIILFAIAQDDSNPLEITKIHPKEDKDFVNM